jgi:hypothetical protein
MSKNINVFNLFDIIMEIHLRQKIISLLIKFIIDHEDDNDVQLRTAFRELEAEIRRMAKYYVMRKEYSAKEIEQILDELKNAPAGGLTTFPVKTQQKFIPELQRMFIRIKNWTHLLRYWS